MEGSKGKDRVTWIGRQRGAWWRHVLAFVDSFKGNPKRRHALSVAQEEDQLRAGKALGLIARSVHRKIVLPRNYENGISFALKSPCQLFRWCCAVMKGFFAALSFLWLLSQVILPGWMDPFYMRAVLWWSPSFPVLIGAWPYRRIVSWWNSLTDVERIESEGSDAIIRACLPLCSRARTVSMNVSLPNWSDSLRPGVTGLGPVGPVACFNLLLLRLGRNNIELLILK